MKLSFWKSSNKQQTNEQKQEKTPIITDVKAQGSSSKLEGFSIASTLTGFPAASGYMPIEEAVDECQRSGFFSCLK